MIKILVVGGGASGMMAAISAANSNTELTIYEKNMKLGKKILATGNGKCNMTNRNFSLEKYYVKNKEKLCQYFQQFDVEKTIHFFNNLGLMTREKDGYVYPYCEQASAVLDILLQEITKNNINIKTEVHDLKLKYDKNGEKFVAESNLGKEYFDKLILACGSIAGVKKDEKAGYDLAEGFRHHKLNLYPALVQVHCKEKFFKIVSGVRAKAEINLIINSKFVDSERGELQLTDYGVSGIPVFQLSRQIAMAIDHGHHAILEIDFLPDITFSDWKEKVISRVDNFMGRKMYDCLLGTLHKKLLDLFIKTSNLEKDCIITKKNRNSIIELMLNFKKLKLTAVKTNSFENAQVCAGGIDLDEVDLSLQSKLQKNLYLCGEMLDVDGKCGGYNLQWAWTSGYIAGKNAAK